MEEIDFLKGLKKWFEDEKYNIEKSNMNLRNVIGFLSFLSIIFLVLSPFFPHCYKGGKILISILNWINLISMACILFISGFVFKESISGEKDSIVSAFIQKWANNIVLDLFTLILPIVSIVYKLFLGYGLLDLLKDAFQNNNSILYVVSFTLFGLKFIFSVLNFFNTLKEKCEHHLFFRQLNPSQRQEFNNKKREAGIPICPLKLEILHKKQRKKQRSDNCKLIIESLDEKIEKMRKELMLANLLKNANITPNESVEPAILEQKQE